MYVDRFPLALALRLPVPCNLSGIYFRPTFYYQTFLGYNAPKTSWYLNRIVQLDRTFPALVLDLSFPLANLWRANACKYQIQSERYTN